MLGLLGLLGAIMVGLLADGMISTPVGEEPDDEKNPDAEPSEVDHDNSILDPRAEPDPQDSDSASKPGGSAGTDFLSGGAEDDLLVALDGDDDLKGYGGADSLFGGEGRDMLRGDEGADQLSGGGGDDTLHGGDGDDTLWGGEGDDLLAGQMGDDLMQGGAGADTMHGGDGRDTLYGQDGADVLTGEDGADVLIGGGGADDVAGGAGDDVLTGDFSLAGEDDGTADTINGQDGNDVIHLGAGDYGAGQAGEDSFVLQGAASGQPPAVITDFTPGEDSLVVTYDPLAQTAPVVTVASDSATGHATLPLDGVPMATILGAAGLDPAQIEVRAA